MKVEERMYSSSEIKILLGKRIKELRKSHHLTQEQLAEKMEIDQRNLSKIECGNNFITAETLSRISKALKIEPQELFHFNYHRNEAILREELLSKIYNNEVDTKLLYKLYQAIKD